jgi:asparagine N-glycosylation enzyme membrane subunit Stt3
MLRQSGGGVVRRLGRGITRVITRHPVLVIAFGALLLRFGLPLVSSGFQDGVVGYIWTASTLWLRPFSLIATWVDPYLRGFPEFLDVAGTLLLGLVPYAAVDVVYRVLTFRAAPVNHSAL